MVMNPPANARDLGLIPGLRRSPVEGSGNPLQYSCLENLMDGGAWRTTLSWGPKELGMSEQLKYLFGVTLSMTVSALLPAVITTHVDSGG